MTRAHSRWALVAFVGVAEVAGLVGLPFADTSPGSWYAQLEKPGFNPPSWLLGPIWAVLYLAIGVAAWMVWRHPASRSRTLALRWWAAQLALNAAWTPVFFGAHAALPALIEIVVTLLVIIATTGAFGQVDRRASQLLLPYLAWVTFAALLNGAIAALN